MYTPFRYDYVGSFLRPQQLKQARLDFSEGKINAAQLKKIEDKCISELIAKLKQLGYHVITDGEFRRSTWHLDFMWGFNGVDHKTTQFGIPFHDEAAKIDDTFLVGKISVNNHPFIEHFKFVKQFEDENTVAKQTIPAPAQFLEQMIMPFNIENTKKYYPNTDELVDDIVKGYHKVILDLYSAGCRNLQFDDCTWGLFVDPNAKKFFATDEQGLLQYQQLFLDINNIALAVKPDDMVINTHICRGNFHSTWACSGGYDKIAPYVFAQENVDALYLEFDDIRSGSFKCLSQVSENKKVVLGLITTKKSDLEDIEFIKKRIQDATNYIPLDRLYISPQCGFASCEIGNKLSEQQQWDKLTLVKTIADQVWSK